MSASDSPPRIVMRGRPGFGRTTLLAAIAEKVSMPLAVIDAERLPQGDSFPSRLLDELQRATLRGALPCVSGLENRPHEEKDLSEHLREVFRSFAGPIGFRTSVEFHVPLDPGFYSFTLPTLLESEREAVWQRALESHELSATSVATLAARYLVGPGTIESIVATVATRIGDADRDGDLTAELDSAARQHLEARLGDVANRVSHLARWEQVALPWK